MEEPNNNWMEQVKQKQKQKQKGAKRMLLPSVEGEKEGKWIVVDSGMFTSINCFEECVFYTLLIVTQ